jgi:hypothetical protein
LGKCLVDLSVSADKELSFPGLQLFSPASIYGYRRSSRDFRSEPGVDSATVSICRRGLCGDARARPYWVSEPQMGFLVKSVQALKLNGRIGPIDGICYRILPSEAMDWAWRGQSKFFRARVS